MNAMGRSQTQEPAPETRGITIQWAHLYDAVVRILTLGKDKAIREMTVEMAQIKPGDKVLDVGCGTGDLTLVAKAWAGPAGQVCGTDAAPEMIEVARRKAAQANIQVDFRVDLIEKISFPDDYFDVVLSSMMIHHLPDDLKRQGLAEISRVLKPGGRLLVVDIKRPSTFVERASMAFLLHRRMQSGIQDLPALMKEAGFTHIEVGDAKLRVLGFARGQAGA